MVLFLCQAASDLDHQESAGSGALRMLYPGFPKYRLHFRIADGRRKRPSMAKYHAAQRDMREALAFKTGSTASGRDKEQAR